MKKIDKGLFITMVVVASAVLIIVLGIFFVVTSQNAAVYALSTGKEKSSAREFSEKIITTIKEKEVDSLRLESYVTDQKRYFDRITLRRVNYSFDGESNDPLVGYQVYESSLYQDPDPIVDEIVVRPGDCDGMGVGCSWLSVLVDQDHNVTTEIYVDFYQCTLLSGDEKWICFINN